MSPEAGALVCVSLVALVLVAVIVWLIRSLPRWK